MGLFLGLISGTSLDAIDAALMDFDVSPLSLIAASAVPFEPALKERITALVDAPDRVSLDAIGQIDVAVGQAFARSALALMQEAGVSAAAVSAIGCHGQTLRHRTDLPVPFTWQIGDPNTVAEMTGVTVVGDFRRRDVAAGGQGAPLLPVFHDQVFRSATEDRVIVNLGGIANVTLLKRGAVVSGFDTGPANRLLDAWISRHRRVSFDGDRAWAGTGRCDPGLLEQLMNEPYLQQQPPKSTGRELFNLEWLDAKLAGVERRPEDVQATLLEYTAATVAADIRRYAPEAAVYACGGGARNAALLAALARRLAPNPVATTVALGLDPDYVEAMAFGWFARRTLAGLASNAPSVTGARGPRILGGIYRSAP
jgi:anhydro-N-acetylmuramic acid kinase